MRTTTTIVAAVLLGGGLMIGCDTEETPTTPPQPTPQAQTPAAQADRQARDVIGQAQSGAKDATATATDAANQAAGEAKAAGDQATAAAGDAANATTAQAQKLFDQATQYVKENKLDLAEKAVAQLEGMKASLPAEWQPRVEQVRSMLNSAKKTGNLLPGGPGGTGAGQ